MAFDLRDRIAGRLRDIVATVATPLDKGAHDAAIVAIASSKGGVGKTTTAVNLAMAYARCGVDVLLMDLDPQAHVTAALHLDSGANPPLLSDVLLGRRREVCEVTRTTRWPHLHVAGSEKHLAETEMVLSAKIGKELLLEGAMQITRTRHALVLIDCPPNLGTLTLNALCAADHLLIPSDMSILALEGVADIINTVNTLQARLQRHVQVCGILKTRFDRRSTKTNQTIEQSFVDLYGDTILRTNIPQSSSVNKAHLSGQSIFDFDARSVGAQAYADLAIELAPRLGLSHMLAKPSMPVAPRVDAGNEASL